MLLTERNNVPTAVGRTVFLDMGTYFWLLNTVFFRAVGRKRLATEFLPMIEPATAFANILTGTIDVLHFHGSLLSVYLAPTI